MIKTFICSQKINAADVELQSDINCQNIVIIFEQESHVDFLQSWFSNGISDVYHSKFTFLMVSDKITVQTFII